MDFKDFTAGKDDDGRRLDRVLRIFLKDKSLGEIYKLIRKGLIKVNHSKTKPEAHVNQGDIISIALFLLENHDDAGADFDKAPLPLKTQKPRQSQQSQPSNLKILFENEDLLIIDKPYGISVHGSEKAADAGIDKEVISYYEANIKDKKEASLSFRPGPLHRLDRNTTGLLVFSLSLQGAKWFSESIKNHTVQKKYLGIAEGKLDQTQTWEDKIQDSDSNEDGFYTVTQDDQGKTAVTIAKPLLSTSIDKHPVTLVEYTIKTGRKHQIRLQSQLHKHPLAGDKAYGGQPFKELKREYYLHAYSLTFPEDNPLKLPSELKTELPQAFKQLLQGCDFENLGL